MRNRHDMNNRFRSAGYCYYIGLAIGILGLICICIFRLFDISILHIVPPCTFFSVSNYYCFGCGGTRALNALLNGKILESFYYHPFVLYMLTIYLIYMVKYTLYIVTNGKIKQMRFRPLWLYLAVILIIVQCIVKNVMLWKRCGGLL